MKRTARPSSGGVDLGGHRAGRTAPGALPACEPYVQGELRTEILRSCERLESCVVDQYAPVYTRVKRPRAGMLNDQV